MCSLLYHLYSAYTLLRTGLQSFPIVFNPSFCNLQDYYSTNPARFLPLTLHFAILTGITVIPVKGVRGIGVISQSSPSIYKHSYRTNTHP